MIGQISSALAKKGMNIIDMLNKSKGDVAYSIIDIDKQADDELINELESIKGVLNVRTI
jgi:D-3-phosphoglycerate dehydrogenase